MDVYAFKNSSIENSASGAAFPTIIQAMQSQSNLGCLIVYGAAFGNHFHVEHIRAKNPEDFIRLQGSKYVRSELGNTLKNVQSDLIKGHWVLFSGTPCQVYAVKNYMKVRNIDTEKLLLVDIICHGTPKPEIWSAFVQWLEKKYKSELIDFSFRYQKAKWKNYPVMAAFKNGKQIINGMKIRLFTNLFGTHLIMCDCCYQCKFSNLERPSDITIGDFWGIETVMPDFPYRDSVSEMLVNTEKGKRILDMILIISRENDDAILEQCHTDAYLKYQLNLNKPTEKPCNVYAFWEDYQHEGIEYILKKYAGNNLIDFIKHCIRRFRAEH